VLTLRKILTAFSRVLNREVRYEAISHGEWRNNALARGVNAHAVENLSHLWRAICLANTEPQAPRFKVTDTIEVIGGTKPKTFEEFLRGERALDA
jgi:hypothetical protein